MRTPSGQRVPVQTRADYSSPKAATAAARELGKVRLARELRRGEQRPHERITLRQWWDRWTAGGAPRQRDRGGSAFVDAKTVQAYKHALTALGLWEVRLDRIDAPMVNTALRGAMHYAPSTRRLHVAALWTVLQGAVKEGALPSMPFYREQLYRPPRPRTGQAGRRMATRVEKDAALAVAAERDLGIGDMWCRLALLYESAHRPQDVRQLRVGDVYMTAPDGEHAPCVAFVDEGRTVSKGGEPVVVPVSPALGRELERLTEARDPSAWLFPSTRSGGPRPSLLTTAEQGAVRAHPDVSTDWQPYMLKHLRLHEVTLARGELVARRLAGHRTVEQSRTYQHAADVDLLAARLPGALEPGDSGATGEPATPLNTPPPESSMLPEGTPATTTCCPPGSETQTDKDPT